MIQFGQNLTKKRQEAIAEVNVAIGRIRSQYITVAPGQDMIYLAKEREALAYVAENPEPADLSNYPFLAAEVGITAPTAYEVAQVILNLAGLWRVVGSTLEQSRLTTIKALEEATTVAGINAVMGAFWS